MANGKSENHGNRHGGERIACGHVLVERRKRLADLVRHSFWMRGFWMRGFWMRGFWMHGFRMRGFWTLG